MGKYRLSLTVWWPKFWIRSDRFHNRCGALLVWYFLFGFQSPPGIDCIVIRLIAKRQHFSSIHQLVRSYTRDLLKIRVYLFTDFLKIPALFRLCSPVLCVFIISSCWANLANCEHLGSIVSQSLQIFPKNMKFKFHLAYEGSLTYQSINVPLIDSIENFFGLSLNAVETI